MSPATTIIHDMRWIFDARFPSTKVFLLLLLFQLHWRPAWGYMWWVLHRSSQRFTCDWLRRITTTTASRSDVRRRLGHPTQFSCSRPERLPHESANDIIVLVVVLGPCHCCYHHHTIVIKSKELGRQNGLSSPVRRNRGHSAKFSLGEDVDGYIAATKTSSVRRAKRLFIHEIPNEILLYYLPQMPS